jgi:hypothetical protein
MMVRCHTGHWSIALNRPDKVNALSAGIAEEPIDVVERVMVGKHLMEADQCPA